MKVLRSTINLITYYEKKTFFCHQFSGKRLFPLATCASTGVENVVDWVQNENIASIQLSYPSPVDVSGTRLPRQAHRKQNMADETKAVKSSEMSPTVMKHVSSRPGSISPALTHFSGALMELDEYR